MYRAKPNSRQQTLIYRNYSIYHMKSKNVRIIKAPPAAFPWCPKASSDVQSHRHNQNCSVLQHEVRGRAHGSISSHFSRHAWGRISHKLRETCTSTEPVVPTALLLNYPCDWFRRISWSSILVRYTVQCFQRKFLQKKASVFL